MEADPDPYPCLGYDCIEAVPNAFERRIFAPGERIEWTEGVFFFDVATGRTEAYRVEGADPTSFSHDGAWITAGVGSRHSRRDWDLVLHRESGQAWRWPEGTHERLVTFLRDELQLDYPDCVTYPDPRPPLGQAGWYGVTCDEAPAETATSAPACQGRISPDGQYVAQQWGQPTRVKYREEYRPLHAIPSVVIADARTCAPIYRVVGAYAYQHFWEGQWLSNSEGFVVGVMDGYAVARVHPAELVYLPPPPTARDSVFPWPPRPVPAPTGDGRYFAYDFAGVYDAGTDRWTLTGFDDAHWGPFSWGETHEEMRYGLYYWGEGWIEWDVTEPRIEFPPFEEIAFRVAATDSCLDLRDEPNSMAAVLDCLADGTRVIATMPPLSEASCLGRYSTGTCLPMTRAEDVVRQWVYVRVESGASGWVAHSLAAMGDGGNIEVRLSLRPDQPAAGGPAPE